MMVKTAKRKPAKRARQKVYKSPRAAAKALKARASTRKLPPSLSLPRKGGGDARAETLKPAVKLDRDTPSRPDAVARRVLAPAVAIEHPKGFPPRISSTRWPAEIIVGQRHRRDYGDLKSLAGSIDARGALLQPVVISPDNELIAGDRRLKAWPLTKFRNEPIPVRVVTIDSIVAGEWDENAERKDFTPSEAVALKKEIEKQLKALARERQRSGKKAAPEVKGQAGDQAARVAGRARRTLEKAEAVIEAAKREPERFGKLKDDMDRTGKVNGPFKRLNVMRQTDALRKAPPPLPMQGPYKTVLIDFPVPAEGEKDQTRIDAAGRSFRGYPEMSIDACCAFARDKIMPILDADCSVWLTFPNFHIVRGFAHRIISAFAGFKPVTMVTWEKDKIGRGQVLRDKTEHAILITRGRPVFNVFGKDPPTTWLPAPRRENSRKPDELYALIERVAPAPRFAEIFSRGGRGENWDCHGDEIGKFAATPSAVTPGLDPGVHDAAPRAGQKKKVRRTLPGRDADLIAFAENNGHVVSMTIKVRGSVGVATIGTCVCGWSHCEPRDNLAQDDPEGVKLRIARAVAMDDAISAHWREQRARAQDGDATGEAAVIAPSPHSPSKTGVDALMAGEGIEAAPQEEPGEGAQPVVSAEPPHPTERAEGAATGAAPVARSDAADDPLEIPGFLRRPRPGEPPRATTLVNPKLLPRAQDIAAIADRAQARAK